MMANLVARGARLAERGQRQRIDRIAGELRKVFGDGAVQVEDTRVLVRGTGLIKRWLIDPNLRFLQRFAR